MRATFRSWSALVIAIVAWSTLSAQDGFYDWKQGRDLHPGIRFVRIEASRTTGSRGENRESD